MTEKKAFKRWYDEDPATSIFLHKIETLDDTVKRQVATFLMEEIITKPPYVDMFPDEIYKLATNEHQKRRWYDFDEVIRLFIELLRHAPLEVKREISIMAMAFIED